MLPLLLLAPLAQNLPSDNLALAVRLNGTATGFAGVVSVDELGQGGADLNGDGDADDRVAHSVQLMNGAVSNLAVAADPIARSDQLVVLQAHEANQEADLNLDGDLADSVLYALDVETGLLELLPFAVPSGFFQSIAVDRRKLAFLVSEQDHGGQDLNADGDAADLVLFVHDALLHTTSNTRLASRFAVLERNTVGALVSEADQGQDLDGDGLLQDLVLCVAHPLQGGFANTSLSCLLVQPRIESRRILVSAHESEAGGVGGDLNGDGDLQDTVAVLWDLRNRIATAIPLAMSPGDSAAFAGDAIVLSADELFQGGTDLNGDGDVADRIVHVVELPSLQAHNLGVTNFQSGSLSQLFARGPQVCILAMQFLEGTDLNGDGDLGDPVFLVYDTAARVLTNTGLTNNLGFPWFTPTGFGFAVYETGHGQDRNGDGDLFDDVAAFYSFATRTTTNIGRAHALAGNGDDDGGRWRGFPFLIPEFNDANQDLNGDGDTGDRVLVLYDPVLDLVKPTGLASHAGAQGAVSRLVSGRYLLEAVSEPMQGATDLNGDGDALDAVLHVVGPLY